MTNEAEIDRWSIAKDLDQRKTWYSSVAEAYDRTRPGYSAGLIQRAITLAQLPLGSNILEVGCGPGVATVAFAELGFSLHCLEPSQEACQIAERNCASYPQVTFQNTTFEEWELHPSAFDAVLAATSFHWVPAAVGYPKAADALRENGALILLWNMQLQPSYELYQVLELVYQMYAPKLAHYEDRTAQAESLKKLNQLVCESDRFHNLLSDQVLCEVTYNVDEYLALLSTYSPYIGLESSTRIALFAGLSDAIANCVGDSIHLSYLSACQVARKA
jgi:ubiquinone/menaquinone biosynthesis C-methylase UbiE